MKRSNILSFVLAVGLLFPWAVFPPFLRAETPATQPAVDDDDEIHLAPVPVGKGDENRRINMAARAGKIQNVFVICPEQTALTSSPQPVLYWAVSEATKDRIDIAVIEPGNPAPFFKETLHGVTAGLHRVDLSDPHHPSVPLEKDKDCKFTVSLTKHTGDSSETTFSSGFVRFVDAPKIDKPTPAKLANAGLWCDAVDLLCRRIEADPTNQTLRKRRVDLFRKETVFVNPGAEQAIANTGPKLEDAMLALLDAPETQKSK